MVLGHQKNGNQLKNWKLSCLTNTGFMTQLGFIKKSYPPHTFATQYPAKQSILCNLMMLIIAGDIEANPGPERLIGQPSQKWQPFFPAPALTCQWTGQIQQSVVMHVTCSTISHALRCPHVSTTKLRTSLGDVLNAAQRTVLPSCTKPIIWTFLITSKP